MSVALKIVLCHQTLFRFANIDVSTLGNKMIIIQGKDSTFISNKFQCKTKTGIPETVPRFLLTFPQKF